VSNDPVARRIGSWSAGLPKAGLPNRWPRSPAARPTGCAPRLGVTTSTAQQAWATGAIATPGAGAAETEEVFRFAGLMGVVGQEGAIFFDHNRPPFTAVALEYKPEADVLGPQAAVMVNPRVLTL